MEININISNYEEYLLCAVDGELSGDEMVALEVFLQQHPHIREELALLESVRLTPDEEVAFDDKARLYRQSTVLSAANYESQLLDYIDNELHGPEKQALELLIQQHSDIRQELNILKQARLQPDLSLHFENKAILYRNNRTKVRPIWWWSAAAAVVAGVAVLVWAPLISERSVQVAVNKPAIKKTDSQQTQPVNPFKEPVAATPDQANTPQIATNTPVTAKPQKRSTEQYAANTPQVKSADRPLLTGNATVPSISTNEKQQADTDNSNVGLTKLAQPVATSGEVVEQLQNKINEQQVAAIEKAPVMANASTSNKVSEAVTAAAPVQGELVVSVTMNGDSKLLNGVANVARFFSKKKK